jgi:hypothetical protein
LRCSIPTRASISNLFKIKIARCFLKVSGGGAPSDWFFGALAIFATARMGLNRERKG